MFTVISVFTVKLSLLFHYVKLAAVTKSQYNAKHSRKTHKSASRFIKKTPIKGIKTFKYINIFHSNDFRQDAVNSKKSHSKQLTRTRNLHTQIFIFIGSMHFKQNQVLL